MKIYYIIGISILVLCLNLVYSKNLSTKPIKLLNSLHDNNGWEILDSSSNNLVSTKEIQERDLFAVMVKKDIELPKKILQNVIMDVNNYKQLTIKIT